MAMKKTGDAVPAEVFTGEEAVVLNTHLQKRGKALSDFTDNQRDELEADLAKVRETQEESQPESSDE
jgi:hypothetical protein